MSKRLADAEAPLPLKRKLRRALFSVSREGASLPMPSFSKPGAVPPKEQSHACAHSQRNELLVRFAGLLPHSGYALDIACGHGQNTIYLAQQGMWATGVDHSRKALRTGRESAIQSNLKLSFVEADLTRFALPDNTFSVAICFKYRDPHLYPVLRSALRPGGLLIYETYTLEHLKYGRKPLNPEHLLERNELLKAFGNWEVIFYREVWQGPGVASIVARKPCAAPTS